MDPVFLIGNLALASQRRYAAKVPALIRRL